VLGDHADHFAAGFEHGVGDDAHQADVAAAVDEAEAFAGDALAEGDGCGCIAGIVAGVGAAVDAEGFHSDAGIGD
jgi:hypothetical protein